MIYSEKCLDDLVKKYNIFFSDNEYMLTNYYHYDDLLLHPLKEINNTLTELQTFHNKKQLLKQLYESFKTKSSEISYSLKRSHDSLKQKVNFHNEDNEYIEYSHLEMILTGDELNNIEIKKMIFEIANKILYLNSSLIDKLPELCSKVRSKEIKDHLQNIIENPSIIKKNYLRHSR